METTSAVDLKLKLNELEDNSYYDSSVYPSNSPINKKPSTSSADFKLFDLAESQDTNTNNIDGNELYHNLNQSLFSLKSSTNNDENIFTNKTQTIDNTMSNYVNSEEFTEDIFRVNQETYRVDTRRSESKISNQIYTKDSSLSERHERAESKLSNQIEKDSLESGRTTLDKEIDEITDPVSNNDLLIEEPASLGLNHKRDFNNTSLSIKVIKEKSFIIDLYNKTNNTNFEPKSPTPVKISKTTPRLDSTTPIMSNNSLNQKIDSNIHNNDKLNTPPPAKLQTPPSQPANIGANAYLNLNHTPNNNTTNKATEDFLNELRSSNTAMQYQSPITPRKGAYPSSPSQKPPHFVPPLNASNKYMSYGMNNSSMDNYNNVNPNNFNNVNYDAYNNGFQNNNMMYANVPSRSGIRGGNGPTTFNLAQPVDPMNYNNMNNYQPSMMNSDFDALHSRRRLLHELSSNALATSNSYQIPRSNTIRSRNSSQPPEMAITSTTNNNFGSSLFDETLTSNDMDELIDVMAKRRIAIKKLEIEMQRQHTRASNLIRQSSIEPSLASDRLRAYDIDNTIISYDPRTSLFQARTPNDVPMSSRLTMPPGGASYSNSQLRQTPNAPMIGTLSYPSETNRVQSSDSSKPNIGITPSLVDLNQSVNGSISNRSVTNESKATQTLPLEELGYNSIHNIKANQSSINSEFENKLKSASTMKSKVNDENIVKLEQPQLSKEPPREPTPKIKRGSIESIKRSLDKTRQSHSSFKQINLPIKLKGKQLFWSVAVILRFLDRVKKKSEHTKLKYPTRSGSATIFKIRLLEIMTALHRVYLEPEGPIYGSLMTFIKNPNDMNILFDPTNAIYDSCIVTLCQNVEEIVQRITEFMPKEGILGTNPTKSALLNLISNNNKFPDIYFWETEKPRLEFDENGKIIEINREKAILLLMGSTISRGLITTLLVKPIKFRLLNGDSYTMNTITANNLKILATVLYYIVRMVNDGNDLKMLDFPLEWQGSFHSDKKMNTIYKNSEVSTMLSRCQRLFKVWANEYVKRLQIHLN